MFQSIILGIIQGLTEFLPISSSGHLVLAKELFGFDKIDPSFNIFVQGGTVLSLLAYYLPRIKTLTITKKYFWLLTIATIPAVIAGLFLESYADEIFSSLDGLAIGFLITTAFIWLSKRKQSDNKVLDNKKALFIGVSQAAAILPSLSRSGATIGTAMFLGIKPQEAFDFSFLLSIPVVAGASFLGARHMTWDSTLTSSYWAGFGVAAIVGYLSLVILSKVTRSGKFYIFAPYTLALAIISFFVSRV